MTKKRRPIAAKLSFSFLNENQRAIIYLVLAGMGFGVSDTLTKLSSLSIPISEVVFIRGLATSFCFLVGLSLTSGLIKIFMAARLAVLARGGFEMLATITFISALPHVRMADLTTLAMSSPIVLIIIAMVFYKERVGWHRWAAIAGGVIGVILIVKPDPTGFNAWSATGRSLCLVLGRPRRSHSAGRPRHTVASRGAGWIDLDHDVRIGIQLGEPMARTKRRSGWISCRGRDLSRAGNLSHRPKFPRQSVSLSGFAVSLRVSFVGGCRWLSGVW